MKSAGVVYAVLFGKAQDGRREYPSPGAGFRSSQEECRERARWLISSYERLLWLRKKKTSPRFGTSRLFCIHGMTRKAAIDAFLASPRAPRHRPGREISPPAGRDGCKNQPSHWVTRRRTVLPFGGLRLRRINATPGRICVTRKIVTLRSCESLRTSFEVCVRWNMHMEKQGKHFPWTRLLKVDCFANPIQTMQLSLSQFKRQRREERESNIERAAVAGAGLAIPLDLLNRHVLSDLQSQLTLLPRATFDRTHVPEPVTCFRLSGTHIVVPRAFGLHYLKSIPQVQVRDNYADQVPLRISKFAGVLRDEQQRACEQSIRALNTTPYACIITMPCGFGKTVVGLKIAHALGLRTLIVVHKEFLLTQWKERISQFVPSASVAIVQGGCCPDVASQPDFIIGMLQTLCCRLGEADVRVTNLISTCGLAVIDEAHHMAARCFSELFFHMNVRHIVGLTATPRRKDGLTPILHMHMGDFSFLLENRDAKMDNVTVRYITFSSKTQVHGEQKGGQIQKLKTRLTQDAERNRVIITQCLDAIRAGRNVLCLSDRLAHLKELLASFSDRDPETRAALFVGGQRRDARLFAETHAQMLFGSFAMAQEGLDVPRLDTLILASPASDITQAVGRILRPCETKAAPLIVDISDDLCYPFTRQNFIRRQFYLRNGFCNEETGPADIALGCNALDEPRAD